MTLSRAGFEPAQRGHMCSSARRSNHPATGQRQSGVLGLKRPTMTLLGLGHMEIGYMLANLYF